MKEFLETAKVFLTEDMPLWAWIAVGVVALIMLSKIIRKLKKLWKRFKVSRMSAEDFYKEAEKLANNSSLADGISLAIYYYVKAAEMGHVLAQCKVGRLYYYGSGNIRPDKERGLELLKKSAGGGSVYARIILGRIYEKMRFQDPGEVLTWLEEIADRDAEAQYLLSRMYANKQEWYEKEKGYEAGEWKEDPFCVECYDKAKYWLKEAAKNGSEDARDLYY